MVMAELMEILIARRKNCPERKESDIGDYCANTKECSCYFISSQTLIKEGVTFAICDFRGVVKEYEEDQRKYGLVVQRDDSEFIRLLKEQKEEKERKEKELFPYR
jgi:hypothetical protein